MEQVKILVVGDAPYMPPDYVLGTTGFAILTGKIAPALLAAGYNVHILPRGMSISAHVKEPSPYTFWIPPQNDSDGFGYISYVCDVMNPALILLIGDPGSIDFFRKSVQARRVPNVIFGALEGIPLHRPYSDTLNEVVWSGGRVVMFTENQRNEVVRNSGMPERVSAVGLGIDHANFRRYATREREAVRERLGWTDRFVLIDVARNAGRKKLDRLFQVMDLLKPYPGIQLYLHTVPFVGHQLGGHNLRELQREMGLQESVILNEQLNDPVFGIPYDRDGLNGSARESVTLIDLYNAADLFVSTSGAEGWNLPAQEAAACGLPVLMPEYSGAWEAAQDFAIGIPLNDPDDFEYFPRFGSRMANVRPTVVAKQILLLQEHPEMLKQASQRGMELAQQQKWKDTTNRIVELVGEVLKK